jgi:ATP-binding cassette subfamily C protein/ATP-binding cassette subfamily C protein LapB
VQFEPKTSYGKCLLPLLDALGWRGEHSVLLEALPPDANNIDFGDLLRVLENLRFTSREKQKTLHGVDSRLLPIIFIPEESGLKKESCWVVLKEMGNKALIFDGGESRFRQVSRNSLKGSCFFFEKTKELGGWRGKIEGAWFLREVAKHKQVLLLVLFLSFLISFLVVLSPVFIMAFYHQVAVRSADTVLIQIAAGMVIYLVAFFGFRQLRLNLLGWMSAQLGHTVGNEVFRRLLYLPPSYTELANLNSQISRIRDFDTVQDFFSGPAIIAISEIPFLVILILAMFLLGGVLVVVPIVAVAIFIVFGALILPWLHRKNNVAADCKKQLGDFVLESFTHSDVIRFMGAEQRWMERHRELAAEAALQSAQVARMDAIVFTFSHALVSISGICTMAVGASLALDGKLPVSGLVAGLFLVWRILAPFSTVFNVYTQFNRIQRSIDQLDRFMNLPQERRPDSSMRIAKPLDGEFSFQNVSVKYVPDAQPALLGVSFDISHGEILAVVGHSGSGKSVIPKLLLGMYSPQTGRVLINQTNVQQMDPIKLRRAISYLPQQLQFFNGTVRENLTMSKLDIDDDTLQKVIQKSGLQEDLDLLKDGLNTPVMQGSKEGLPSSLLKKLSYARFLLHESKLVIMDSPESTVTPSLLVEEISQKRKLKTQVLITESPELLALADKILWLDKGKRRAFGTAAEVLPLYKEGR